MIATVYVYWRKCRLVRENEWEYQLYVITETRPAQSEEANSESALQTTLKKNGAERLNEWLKEASAKTAANYVEGAIWSGWQTSDNLSFEQAINFLTGVSDNLYQVVEDSLESLADATALPAPVNIVGSNVVATMLIKPIAGPIEDLTHGLELLGIFLGLVIGLHPLVMTCAKYLIHDELGNALTHAINSALDSMFGQLREAFGAEVRIAGKAAGVAEADNITPESIVQDSLSVENIRQRQPTEDPTNYLLYFSSCRQK
jgi:hypothetical protein